MPRFILLVLLLLSFASPTLAADSALDATVNLYCRLKAGKTTYSATGSGDFINDRGVILTNAHVAQYFLLAKEKGRVSGWCAVRTGSPANEAYVAEVLYISPTWLSENLSLISETRPKGTGEGDFALLYVTGPYKNKPLPASFPSLPLATTTPVVGTAVTVTGYPSVGLDFSGVRNKLKNITAETSVENLQGFTVGTREDRMTLASSSAAHFGVSGGPVITSQGAVAGIVSAKSGERIRAVATSYIDRSLKTHTGLTLSQVATGDLASRAAITRLLLPEGVVAALEKGLRAKK